MACGPGVVVLPALALALAGSPAARAQTPADVPLLELRMAREVAAPGLVAVEVQGETLYLEPDAVLSDRDFERVEARVRSGELILDFRLTVEGARRIEDVSTAEIGSRVAVLVDSAVRLAPVIRDRIGGRGLIQIEAEPAELERLAGLVRARWP